MDAEKLAMQRRIDNLLKYIDHLHGVITEYERQNAKLTAELEAVKREKDAALVDLKKRRDCKVCKYYVRQAFEEPCVSCGFGQRNWEWRGLCESNGGAEDEPVR